jgi:ABC-type antimicrobial peptide transport system permease subunit
MDAVRERLERPRRRPKRAGVRVALNRLLASLLFGVEPTDPITLVAVTCAIAIAALVACAFPAWRASRLDPNIVLREA